MFGADHWESPAGRALMEVLTCQDMLTPALPRSTPLLRTQARLALIARYVSRPPRIATLGRAVSGSEPLSPSDPTSGCGVFVAPSRERRPA
jgi:hypothetical protein